VIEAVGGRRREDTLLVASWRLLSGGGSAELLLAGAIAGLARHDHSLAERLARAAIDEGGGFEAKFLAAEAAHFLGRPDQAEHELAALAAETTSDAERARVALVRFDNAYFLHGRAEFELLEDAAEAITDPTWRDQVLSKRSYARSLDSGPRAAVEAASTLLESSPSRRLTAAHVAVAYSLLRLGRLDDAVQLLSPSSDIAAIPATDEPWLPWSAFRVRALALVYAGSFAEAEELLNRAYDQVVDQPAAEARAYVAGALALLHLEQGRVQSALRRANESYTLYQQLGRRLFARLSYGAATQALALAGQATRAAETLSALDSLELPITVLYETDLLQARAWTSAAAGNIPAARHQFEAAADLGEEIGDLIGATNALHGLARVGRARDVASHLAALATQIGGDLVTARAAYANALAERDAAAVDKVAHTFEDLGAYLDAAEAQAEAAVLLRRGDRARAAAAAERQAAQLLARCEGATTPAVQTIIGRVRLEPAELETALQAAAGRSNRQIADEMYLPVRTVENRLQHVYEKLGISSRHELADALRDRPTI
jgi:DNA-binding CsgD family transcriptional regulator